MLHYVSGRLRHFFHVVSNIRPIFWIALYVALTPVFALIYWHLPEGQFRIPDGAGTDFGSWLYYSIVTITTLGFGDYTPAGGIAQAVTAVEVMCGLIFLGFFLNAVGSMKSELDVDAEIERQQKIHASEQRQMLLRHVPRLLRQLNLYLAYCYAVTTPKSKRTENVSYNPNFTLRDMEDMYGSTDLPEDASTLPAVERLLSCAASTSLVLDSLQNRLDLRQWPDVLENCFDFVAHCQMFESKDIFMTRNSEQLDTNRRAAGKLATESGEAPDEAVRPVKDLYEFVKATASSARQLETALTSIASAPRE